MSPGPSAALWAAVDARIAAAPTRPLLTCYLDPPPAPRGPDAPRGPAEPGALAELDDGSGADRIDLTGTTWSTWVAKTVNLLLELGGVEAGSGARVLLRLPPHWQTAVWTEAALRIGARVTLDLPTGRGAAGSSRGDPDGLAVQAPGEWAVVAHDRAGEDAANSDDAAERFFLPLRAMNAPGTLSARSTALGAWDYAAEVSVFGDQYALSPRVAEQAAAAARLTTRGGHPGTDPDAEHGTDPGGDPDTDPSPGRGGAALDGTGLGDSGLDGDALDGARLVAAADARAATAGLGAGGRLLATGWGVGGPFLDLLAAARRGGSVVLAPDADSLEAEQAQRRWAAERVTATVPGCTRAAGGLR